MSELPLDWGTDAEEDPEDINAALARVRKEGSKKKAARRSAVGGTLALLLVAGVVFYSAAGPERTKTPIATPPLTTPSTATTQIENITLASQVIAKAEDAYGSAKNVSGTSTVQQYCTKDEASPKCDPTVPESTDSYEFKFRQNGDIMLRSLSNGNDKSAAGSFTKYDAGTLQIITYSPKVPGNPDTPAAFLSSNQRPDSPPFLGTFGHFDLTSLLDGLSADQNASLRTIQYKDQDAWEIHAKGLGTDSLGYSPDEVLAVFDKVTLFPLAIHELRQGARFQDVTIDNLNRDAHFTDADFAVDTHGLKPHFDAQSSPVYQKVASTDALAKLTSYKPLVPQYVPDGFTLSSIAFSKDTLFSGGEGVNRNNKDVVAFTYRKGLQTIYVATRAVGPNPQDWVDPLGFEGQQNAGDDSFIVQGGAYNGTKAHLVMGFGVTPHVWIVGATTVTTVNGDASAEQLKQILASLKS